ncbi:MAG: hypothetical protein CSYNP_03915 [Syntrophus sp. SKADARSKE-3]|nr:hypothetical protein [Syntrophus sp. SKADARSKE-3]
MQWTIRVFTDLPLTSGAPAVINLIKNYYEENYEENTQAF